MFDAKGKTSDKRWTYGAARRARSEQGGPAVHRAGRGQGRGAAHREPSGSRVGSVDVDAGDRARPPHRAAGSLHAVLRHRLQLRGSRGARRQPVRLPHAPRRRTVRRRGVLEDRLDAAKQSKSSQYTRSIVWIRKDNYAFARIENYVKDQVVRRLNYTNIQNVQGIWTARQLEMTDLRRGSRTRLTLDKLEYNVPLKDEDFTLQAIRRTVTGATGGGSGSLVLRALRVLCAVAPGRKRSRNAAFVEGSAFLFPQEAPNDPTRGRSATCSRARSCSSSRRRGFSSPAASTSAPTPTIRWTIAGASTSTIAAPGGRASRCAASPRRSRAGRSPSTPANSSSAGARPTSSTPPTASPRAISSTSSTPSSWR